VAVTALQFLTGCSSSAGGPGKGMPSRLYAHMLNKHGWMQNCTAFKSLYNGTVNFDVIASAESSHAEEAIDAPTREVLVSARARAGARRPRCERPPPSMCVTGAGDGRPCLAAVRGSACLHGPSLHMHATSAEAGAKHRPAPPLRQLPPLGQPGGCWDWDRNLAAALAEAAEGNGSRLIMGCVWMWCDCRGPKHGAWTSVDAEAAAQARRNPLPSLRHAVPPGAWADPLALGCLAQLALRLTARTPPAGPGCRQA